MVAVTGSINVMVAQSVSGTTTTATASVPAGGFLVTPSIQTQVFASGQSIAAHWEWSKDGGATWSHVVGFTALGGPNKVNASTTTLSPVFNTPVRVVSTSGFSVRALITASPVVTVGAAVWYA